MSGKTYLRNKNFFKRNYFEALKFIIPGYLYEDDVSGTPKAADPIDTIINSQIDVAQNFGTILDVSAIAGTISENIQNVSGAALYFVKQNNLTNIAPEQFEEKILSLLGKNFRDFTTEQAFADYVDNTLLPATRLNTPDSSLFSTVGNGAAIHNYLISNMSWMYFLNTSGTDFDPSSTVKDLLVSSLYAGKAVRTNDGINALSEHLWKNASSAYYPSQLFASSTRSDLSGTQQLEKFKTWNDIIYSPLYSDISDFRVRDKFLTYIESNLKFSSKIEDGPFARLIRALSFFAYDKDNDTEEISTLYDIDDCPDDYLPLVAQLIGWDLFGSDPEKWRLQLRNAVSIYKTVGTKKSIQRTVNTIFPKDKFPIEGRVTELWESYVPFLIYYALATESSKFKSFDTWTPNLANEMEIYTYSTRSMDENIRLAVDQILYETVEEFPDKFQREVWEKEFDLTFNYRGRDFEIPPFEEYPYYVNSELNSDMVTFISDRLACFGVNNDFALEVSSYITNKALNKDDEPRLGSFLIFTSGYNEPPNLDKFIRNINDNRFEYASLWSGKSSHFKLVLDASEFDFTKKNLDEVNTGDAMAFVSKAVGSTAPAHSIPLISLEVSAPPDRFEFEASSLPHVYLDSQEIKAGAGVNLLTSGIFLNSYKRGVNNGGTPIGRDATRTLVSPELLSLSAVDEVPRNSARRRSYEKIMPFNGYYDRTGFNMPVGFDMVSSLSGVPLGLVPSSMTYTSVSSHINLPPIWNQCEGLNSGNIYFEYPVSTTQNVRGQLANFQTNTDRTTDRGQLPGIYAAMHRIGENSKYLRADLEVGLNALANQKISSILAGGVSAASSIQDKINAWTSGVTLSYANSATNDSSAGYTFPKSTKDFYNFEFGRDLQKLHHIYQDNFKWHRLSRDVQELDGPNLFSHTFGPLLFNHDFEDLGSAAEEVSTSFASPRRMTSDLSPFVGAGSFPASADGDMYIDTPERVCSGLVDGVELVLTSGVKAQGSFSIIRVPGSQRASFEDPFLFDNTIVLMRSGNDAATRLRFDISKYSVPSNYPISNNFLSPDHEFTLNLSAIISRDSGTTLGGRDIHIWLHTKPEQNKMWTFMPDGKWHQHEQLISREDLIRKYSHRTSTQLRSNDPQSTNSTTDYQCLDQISSNRNSPVVGLGSEDVDGASLQFNTNNRIIRLPKDYQGEYDQLHRLNQNYVVEVFMTPGAQSSEFIIIDKVEIQDNTLKNFSELFVAGTKSDPRLELTKQDIFDIFKHFNNIAGKNSFTSFASRDKNKTSTIMESRGGSRIDYRFAGGMVEITRTLGVLNTNVTIPI
tara:strand:- start:1015 stop:4953 length:3939 start_codon:yes stop_codon:yes gene_type:complete